MKKSWIVFLFPFLLWQCENSPLGKSVRADRAKLLAMGVESVSFDRASVVFQCSEEVIGIVGYGNGNLEKFQTSIYPSRFHHFVLSGLSSETNYTYASYCGKSSFPLGFMQDFRTLAIDPFLETKQRGIWIIGGLGFGGSPVSEVDIFDPVTEIWYPNFTQLPTPRAFASVITLGDTIFVIGGLVLSGGTYTTTNVVEGFHIRTNSWKTYQSMPNRLVGATAGKTGNEIYLIGGTTTTGMTTGTILNTVYRFQPFIESNGTWTQLTALGGTLLSRVDMAGCGSRGTIYHTGGRFFSSGLAQVSSDGYIPASNTTSSLIEASLSVARHGSAFSCYEPIPSDPFPTDPTALFVIGGSTATDLSIPAGSIAPSATFDYYQTGNSTNAMVVGSNLPMSLYYPASAISYQQRKIYVFGGSSSINNPTTNVYSLQLENPSNSVWNTLSAMPRARYGHGVIGAMR
jgi:hypothetical protein